MTIRLHIYNLVFPEYVDELNIGEYKFCRVKKYRDTVLKMTHVVLNGEIPLPNGHQIGTHQITAIVKIPEKEKKSVLAWSPNNKTTKLNDILLLLTLFTEHNVFACDSSVVPLSVDMRAHHEGGGSGEFRSFIKHNYKVKEISTGNILDDFPSNKPKSDFHRIDLGFEETINSVLKLISSKKWKQEFRRGHFLFLFKEIMDQVYVTTKFLMCWTILEHVYRIYNSNLTDKEILKKKSLEKISGIFKKHNESFKKRELISLIKTRNRLVHYGKVPNKTDLKNLRYFLNFTQQLVAKILGLTK